VIADWPVQFLPPSNALEVEAVPTEVEGVDIRVMSAEHLAAIALRTGRPKDYIRLVQFVQQGALDSEKWTRILVHHRLAEKWQQFEHRFLESTNG
jgi:hypothetical protein